MVYRYVESLRRLRPDPVGPFPIALRLARKGVQTARRAVRSLEIFCRLWRTLEQLALIRARGIAEARAVYECCASSTLHHPNASPIYDDIAAIKRLIERDIVVTQTGRNVKSGAAAS